MRRLHSAGRYLRLCLGMSLIIFAGRVLADEPAKAPTDLPLVFQDNFEKDAVGGPAARWEPTDPAAWKVVESARGHAYSLFQQSKYKPPHRSPFNFSLAKDATVSDFVLDARVLSTKPDYNHRDMCLVFGYQDPAHFYYVHFGKKTDDHANQIFIVDDAPRTKISTKTSPGTDWDDNWHQVRIVRTVDDGRIDVYFDDMKTPVMQATNKRFTWGRVGLGTFDDIGDWDDVKLYGRKVEPSP